MPRVVPSDVVRVINRMFPGLGSGPNAAPHLESREVPGLAALAHLVEAVPEDLIVLNPQRYAEMAAAVAYLRAVAGVFQGSRAPQALQPLLRGFEANPIALIREALEACPDEAPTRGTTALAFIGDPELRESIRLDLSAAHRDLAQGEWKGTTVLAGSAIEALLLWALQERDKKTAGTLTGAVSSLRATGTLSRQPDPNPEAWHLHEYVEVAAHLGLIKPETATAVRLAKDFRNLIHPGRAVRLGQKCDRATALGALAAAEAVVRDLSP